VAAVRATHSSFAFLLGDGGVSRATDIDALVAGARAGHSRAVARLISIVEDGSPLLPVLMEQLAADSGHAHVIGLTGAPGVGKSTVTSALVSAYRRAEAKVGVLAIDPSSPFSGGALLGDRIRMQEHATDPGVFIRSMASRGHLGGLAAATPQALRVLDAAGCDVVLIETVGVGQSEVEIAAAADTTVVIVAPGMGDGIQAAKAGILEIGDVFVVNKADRDGAAATARDLRHMLTLADRADGSWTPPVLQTIAAKAEGIDELVSSITAHRTWLVDSDLLRGRRVLRARAEIEALALGQVRARFLGGDSPLALLAEQVVDGRISPHAAAESLLAQVAPHPA
jgi:LAO/AO transport system kinase